MGEQEEAKEELRRVSQRREEERGGRRVEEVMSGRGQELPWETGHSQVHGPRETARGAGLRQKFWSLGVPWTRNCLGGGVRRKALCFLSKPVTNTQPRAAVSPPAAAWRPKFHPGAKGRAGEG